MSNSACEGKQTTEIMVPYFEVLVIFCRTLLEAKQWAGNTEEQGQVTSGVKSEKRLCNLIITHL